MLRRPPPGYIANFDSASAMLRATARFLRGQDFPPMGVSAALKPLMRATSLLPRGPRELAYAAGGGAEGIPAHKIHQVSAERLGRWAVSQYPERPYPAVALGSSNGAAVHLCAAMGIPWLPQTFLIPVRRTGVHPDDMADDMEWGREPGQRLLEANPELQLHHMHDPNQDRLMVEYMTYFRVKRRVLGEAYEQFLSDCLVPGGTILLLDNHLRWPAKKVDDRFYFQPGAIGGLTPEEYLNGSDRVAEYLEHYGSHRRRWAPPEPDGDFPEAEWGFEPALGEDVERFARENGFSVKRLRYSDPQHLAPLVADLHRWWYRQRSMVTNRLLVESFVLMEPYWTLRTGSVPFWCTFPVESSADALEAYLDSADPFTEVAITLFNHGTESAGLAPVERWRSLASRAREKGYLMGVDEDRYPLDFGSFARFHSEVQRIPSRYSLGRRLTLGELKTFLKEKGKGAYSVGWSDLETGGQTAAEAAKAPEG